MLRKVVRFQHQFGMFFYFYTIFLQWDLLLFSGTLNIYCLQVKNTSLDGKNHLICCGRSCLPKSHGNLTARVSACITKRPAGGPVNSPGIERQGMQMASSLRIAGTFLAESKNEKVCMTLCVCTHTYFSKYLQIIFVEV